MRFEAVRFNMAVFHGDPEGFKPRQLRFSVSQEDTRSLRFGRDRHQRAKIVKIEQPGMEAVCAFDDHAAPVFRDRDRAEKAGNGMAAVRAVRTSSGVVT